MIDKIHDSSTKQIVLRTKGKKFRAISLNDSICKIFREMVLSGSKADGVQVFARINYEYLCHEKFKRILKLAGLESALTRRATFHSLRHTFASEFMRCGGKIFDLQQ